MNKNTVKELFICTNQIERAIGAIDAILDSMYEILDDAARRAGSGHRGRGGHGGRCGQDAGTEGSARRDAEITADAQAVLLAAKAMGPMKKEAKPERLPDVPDWRDTEAAKQRDGAAQFAKDDKLTQIRLTVAAHQGEKLSKIIEAIKKDAGISGNELARILGVNGARITEAAAGKPRKSFVIKFTEILGEGSAPVRKPAAKKSGKRGAK